MPKITFYNLPEDKREKLINAVKKEFSRVPLYDASISNIVKSARIPRGSFYQYFEDKEDAFFFLFNAIVINSTNTFGALLRKHNGDLFETMFEFYQFIIEEEENINFLKNAFLNMSYKIENTFSNVFRNSESKDNFREISPLIDTKNLNVSRDKELIHIMQIISTVTIRNVVEKFANDISKEEAMGNYKMDMTLLKDGLARKI
ncbi:TetR/AcrR family transcriptional regulator [Bacillus salipaludis]|uniref:TetR/AcrR family transcriptional regulator n=1 Tax=Bacillus salipaludis TaxID=2547811 RepID=A0ABW8RP34_9BACI